MYVAGFVQASMWKQFNQVGTLTYGNFSESNFKLYNVLDACYCGGTLYFLVGCLFGLQYSEPSDYETITDELAEAPALQVVHQD
jgi:cytochrome c oxidase cbb3-type subunit I/II